MQSDERKIIMQYNNGFDIKGFEEYMNESFSLDEFSQSMVDNLANFAVENQNHSKDQLADFLSDVIPEVEFKEIAGFCEDAILTESYGQEQKREFQEEHPDKFPELFQAQPEME